MDRSHPPAVAGGVLKPSKTRRKREMHALQDLGEKLVELSSERLASIDLPEELRDAVREAQRVTQHEGRRRQLQYIGRLMRAIDAEPIREAIAALEGRSLAQRARLHRVERLRTRLLEDEEVLAEISCRHPDADLQRLRQLRRSILKEKEQGKPPRAFRELFRLLREMEGEGSGVRSEE
jgi:ribosome-associated protein